MDTIFAPICPLGGSIVSVRISGKNAFDFFKFFGISSDIFLKKTLFFTVLKYNHKIIDEVVIKIFKEPYSFTGENIIEIDLHASKIILHDFLDLIAKIPNFRFAKNGEFTKRAFLNGKIDLIKSEGINAIIRAETKKQMNIANEMFHGNIYKKYTYIRNKLIEIMSYIETQIDFSEEEVPQNVINEIQEITNNLIKEINTCLDDKKAIDKINQGISVAIIGKPNVGKSSLLNWLAKRDIAIVSSIAGTTRDILSVDIDLDGYKVIFYDTAGIRESNDEIEQEGVKRAKNIANNADIRIFMYDNFNEINSDINHNDDIFVINKIDIQEKSKADSFQDKFIAISVLRQINLDTLMQQIKNSVLKQVELKQNPLVINERHEILLKQCVDSLNKIDFENLPIEIIGEEIRNAIEKIGQITGQVYTDEILDNIFSKFCIGK